LKPDVRSGPEWERTLLEAWQLHEVLRRVFSEDVQEEPVPVEDLVAYEQATLSPEKREQVEARLKSSVAAARDLYQLRELKRALSGEPLEGADQDGPAPEQNREPRQGDAHTPGR